MTFRADLLGNVDQTFLEPLATLFFDFGIERVVGRIHVEGRRGAGQHRDEIERRA